MPEGQVSGIVAVKLVLHPHPFRAGSKGCGWTLALMFVLPTGMLTTPEESAF